MDSQETIKEGKVAAILAYITIIGLLIAYIMNSCKKNEFASFHIRQGLGIGLTGFAFSLLFRIVEISFLPSIISLLILVLVIIGLIGAIQGERKVLPVIGPYFQEWFKGL